MIGSGSSLGLEVRLMFRINVRLEVSIRFRVSVTFRVGVRLSLVQFKVRFNS